MTVLGFDEIMKVTSYTDLLTPLMAANTGQLAIDVTSMVTYQFNGTTWNPLGRPTVKLSNVSINAMTTGNNLIYTLEALPINFVPTQVITTVVTQTGSIVTAPVITVGTNSTTYDNIAKGSLLGGVLGSLGVGNSNSQLASNSPKLSGGSLIYARVSTAAIGPSVLTLNIDITGYLKA